jgi:hypothetical protein
MAHVKVFFIALFFGLLAYVAINVLLYVSRMAGLLDWLH